MSLQAVPVCLVTMLCVLLGIDFGVLAMLIGAVTGSRGAAVGLASTFAAAAYLISSLASVVPWLHRAPVRLAVLLAADAALREAAAIWAGPANSETRSGVGRTQRSPTIPAARLGLPGPVTRS